METHSSAASAIGIYFYTLTAGDFTAGWKMLTINRVEVMDKELSITYLRGMFYYESLFFYSTKLEG